MAIFTNTSARNPQNTVRTKLFSLAFKKILVVVMICCCISSTVSAKNGHYMPAYYMDDANTSMSHIESAYSFLTMLSPGPHFFALMGYKLTKMTMAASQPVTPSPVTIGHSTDTIDNFPTTVYRMTNPLSDDFEYVLPYTLPVTFLAKVPSIILFVFMLREMNYNPYQTQCSYINCSDPHHRYRIINQTLLPYFHALLIGINRGGRDIFIALSPYVLGAADPINRVNDRVKWFVWFARGGATVVQLSVNAGGLSLQKSLYLLSNSSNRIQPLLRGQSSAPSTNYNFDLDMNDFLLSFTPYLISKFVPLVADSIAANYYHGRLAFITIPGVLIGEGLGMFANVLLNQRDADNYLYASAGHVMLATLLNRLPSILMFSAARLPCLQRNPVYKGYLNMLGELPYLGSVLARSYLMHQNVSGIVPYY